MCGAGLLYGRCRSVVWVAQACCIGGAGLLECCMPVPGIGHTELPVAPVCGVGGAGLLECRMPVPGIGRTELPVAPVCKVSADSRQKGRRPVPRTPQTCATKAGRWGIPMPRFRKNSVLCVLARNVAGIMAEMAGFVAAFPEKRPSVRSSAKRGRHNGRNGRLCCRVSVKTAFCAF